MPRQSIRRGIACLLVSGFGFALMGLFVALADWHGKFGPELPFAQKSFFRNLVAALVAGPVFLRAWRAGEAAVPKTGWTLLAGRAALGTVGIFGNFYAISHIQLGDALMLNKLSPFCSMVFVGLFLGERPSARAWLAVTGAFLGSLFIVRPSFDFAAVWPSLCGFAGGVGAGGAYACLRALARKGVSGAFVVLFFSVFSTCACVPLLAWHYVPMTALQALLLVGAGVAATVGQFGITAAYRFASPKDIAVFDYSNVLFGAVFGFLFLEQVPGASSLAGFAIIIAMAVLMRRPSRP